MRFSGLAFFSVGLVLFLGIGCRTRPVVYSQSLEEVQSGNRIRGEPSFLVVGDTQRTLAVEARLLFREQNDPERTVLVKAMAATQAQFLVHLGDMVSDGSSDSEWRLFDQLFAPVVKQGLSVLPVMGNHDYFGDLRVARQNVSARFAELTDRTWYQRQALGFGFIFLDANWRKLGSLRNAEQHRFYLDALGGFEADTRVTGVFVFSHQPPFTNHPFLGENHRIQNQYLPYFTRSPKTLAWISGHSHSYEHFEIQGKTFIVSGGGGGPRARLLEGTKKKREDLFQMEGLRPFHYLQIQKGDAVSQARVTVYGLKKGSQEIFEMDQFGLPLHR